MKVILETLHHKLELNARLSFQKLYDKLINLSTYLSYKN